MIYSRKRLSSEEVIRRCHLAHGDKYDYSLVEYKNAKTKIKIICKEHNIFEQTLFVHTEGNNHSTRGCGCPYCYKSTFPDVSIYIERFVKVHKDTYDYSKVVIVDSSSKIDIICKIHGKFTTNIHDHASGSGCPQCGQNASIATRIIKYGNASGPLEKSRETLFKKYGVYNPAHIPNAQYKSKRYKRHEYTFSSGTTVYLQGNETKALDILLLNYTESEIVLTNKPSFKYVWLVELGGDGKEHWYFPDMYIPKDNLIIEVKSSWTYDGNGKHKDWLSKNLAKEQTVLNNGYNFKFMIL